MSPYVTKIFYLKSSVPVTTPITSICQIIHEEYREDYEGTEELIFSEVITAKLLQKSEMRKDIVIELSYKGFG